MGSRKFKNIWNRSKDTDSTRAERSFVRYAIVATAFFLIFICFIKRDNLFRWVEAGFTVRSQEKRMEQLRVDNERLREELKTLTTDRDSLEKFAREKFLFAAPGEDVYVEED